MSKETVEALTARMAGIKSQRVLGQELAKAKAAKMSPPHLAAIERRQSARAKEVKAAQRKTALTRDPSTAKKAGKPAPQNSRPIAPGRFGGADAKPLAETYMDKAGDMDLKIAFGDDTSLIRNLEPVAVQSVHPKGGNLVTGGMVSVDTTGLPGRVSASHAYLMDGDTPIGRCELAAPLPLVPGERAEFKPGSLMFKS